MALGYELTTDELNGIIAFVKIGKTDILETNAIDRLYALSSAVGKKLLETNRTTMKKNLTLECRLQRYKLREDRLPEGTFTDTGLDSVDVGLAVMYCLQQKNTFRLTKTKVILILYGIYCSWLGSKKKRLFTEHPVATSWGPQFWRVYKRIDDTERPLPDECFRNIADKSPAIAAFCRNACDKYYDWKENTLREHFLNSEPYRNAMPKNGEKWNKEISDAEIYAWKNPQK